jgi:hypothetical protein
VTGLYAYNALKTKYWDLQNFNFFKVDFRTKAAWDEDEAEIEGQVFAQKVPGSNICISYVTK